MSELEFVANSSIRDSTVFLLQEKMAGNYFFPEIIHFYTKTIKHLLIWCCEVPSSS